MSVYEQIKDDLGYLQLDRAAECFATLAEDARADGWTHVEFLGRLIAEQADATRNRRLSARLRYARFPFRKTIDEFDFDFQPSVDRRLVDDLATLRFMTDGRPILFSASPAAARPTSRSLSPPWPSMPGSAATSPTPKRWSRTSPKPPAKATSPPSSRPTPHHRSL